MESKEQQIVSQPTSKKTHKSILIVFVFFLTLLSGTIGYYIGVSTKEKSKTYQLTLQPTFHMVSPTLTSSPTLTAATLYPTPTLDPTIANWQTYTDAKYGFFFKHPAHWSLVGIQTQNDSQDYADNYSISFAITNMDKPNRSSLAMGVEIHSNVKNWTINQWFTHAADGANPSTLSQEQISLDGYPTIKTRLLPDLENELTIAPLPKTISLSNGLYNISLGGSIGEGMPDPYADTDQFVQKELVNFHKMLSSFRFSK